MTYVVYVNKQQTKLLLLLRTAGSRGVNSYDLRFTFHLIQAPARIKELKEKGFLITTKQKRNRSVNYILVDEPRATIALFEEEASAQQQGTHQKNKDTLPGAREPEQKTLFDGGAGHA